MWHFYMLLFFWRHFNKIRLVYIPFFLTCNMVDFSSICSPPQTPPSTSFTAESQDKSSKHVETGHSGCNQQDGPDCVIPRIKSNSDNIILAEETVEERKAPDRDSTNHPGNSCNRHEWTKP